MATNPHVNGRSDAVDVEASGSSSRPRFSWLDPHPIFVIILVSSKEQPFGIQKDFLCAKSAHFRDHFEQNKTEQIEHIIHLRETPIEVFACAQNFMYTGKVFPTIESLPSYDVLIGVWKLGHELGIDGLCDATLEAMNECRRVTQHIPATPLLVQVWKDTPEGSSIRRLLLEWAAEYMRSSDSRAEFARSLPQEVLSELVVAMSSLDAPSTLTPTAVAAAAVAAAAAAAAPVPGSAYGSAAAAMGPAHRKNVHYLDGDEIEEVTTRQPKKHRHSDVLPNGHAHGGARPGSVSAAAKKPRSSLPSSRPGPKRRGAATLPGQPYSTEKKLEFCADLLTRMLSGPGFWTRLVGPFKEPVDPVRDEVPDYLTRIQKPMDLGTMKSKVDRREYADETEFLADMHQIFTNCYTYWTKKDPMWGACEKLEKTFEEKYAQMNKWIAKMEGMET